MIPDELLRQLKSRADEAALLFDSLSGEARQQFELMLQGMITRMNLVTREEFESLQKVLLRTREKVELLEAELARLEKEKLSASEN